MPNYVAAVLQGHVDRGECPHAGTYDLHTGAVVFPEGFHVVPRATVYAIAGEPSRITVDEDGRFGFFCCRIEFPPGAPRVLFTGARVLG